MAITVFGAGVGRTGIYNEAVRAASPKKQLLIYEVKQGWDRVSGKT